MQFLQSSIKSAMFTIVEFDTSTYVPTFKYRYECKHCSEKTSVTKNCSDLTLWFCKSFSRSLEQFFLTLCQNNFGNKIPFILNTSCATWCSSKSWFCVSARPFPIRNKEVCNGGVACNLLKRLTSHALYYNIP